MKSTMTAMRLSLRVVMIDLFVFGVTTVMAAPPVSTDLATPAASELPRSRRAEPGVLLLKSGRLSEGKIATEADGYVVETATGRFLVPYSLVQFQADSRIAVYQRLRQRQSDPTPDQRLQLARWCLTWNLHDQARDELRAVLEAEPNHAAARRMLVQLSEVLGIAANVPEADTKKTEVKSLATDQRPARSLAGLSRENAVQFVSRVQPILVRRCANAGCHGTSSRQSFQLTRSRSGGAVHRHLAEQNLAAVISLISPDRPSSSHLLQVALKPHGPNQQALFHGAGGQENLQTLRTWVQSVAKEIQADAAESADGKTDVFRRGRPGQQGRTPLSATALLLQANNDDTEQSVIENPGILIRGRESAPAETPADSARRQRQDVLQQVLAAEQPDAFDPEVFNRRFHAEPTQEPSPPNGMRNR